MALRCPVCANTTLAEFYEPAGATLCARCGFVFLRDSLRIETVKAKRHAEFDMRLWERLKEMNDKGADSLDFLELAMELEKSGVTIEDLKAANVQTLEDLKRFMEERFREMVIGLTTE
jgi:acyl carrier protein